MRSRWTDADAREIVDRYGAHGEALALRVYTSRLLGADPALVLHGGGNTSVKARRRSLLGDDLEVIHVKGSGHDLAHIGPRGLPALELAPLRRLRGLDGLDDRAMVNELRRALLDASAPTPSVETLLHAHLPAAFVDHTHADAFLVLSNQRDGEARVRDALGKDVLVLPWIMPGFPLAEAVADAYEQQPACEGIALLGHGLFTWGADARSSYERMIELVTRAERAIDRSLAGRTTMLVPAAPVDAEAAARLAEAALPVVRGALARESDGRYGRHWHRSVGEWRGTEDLVAFSAHKECRALVERGPLTSDHLIRTGPRYLHLEPDQATDPDACRAAVQDYRRWYVGKYFEPHRDRLPEAPVMMAPFPRVAVVRGAGVLAFGKDVRAARIAGDIAAHTLRAKAQGEAIGSFQALPDAELFAMEYWSRQQAKLGAAEPSLLEGQVALVTGAGGAIGGGIAEALLGAGAQVFATDAVAGNLERLERKLAHPGPALHCEVVDVTDPASVGAGIRACCRRFGGLDILVPNAGIAHVSPIADMDEASFQRVVDVNLTGTLNVLKAAARVFAQQRTGGSVIIQASKNVFEPGKGFGAYSASKAGAVQLGRVAALELAELGVRVNMINADAVFGDDDLPSGLWQQVGPDRMRARDLDPAGLREFYRQRSLLGVEVLPAHVGAAVVFFAAGQTPTTGATLPVDGGIPGAFPR